MKSRLLVAALFLTSATLSYWVTDCVFRYWGRISALEQRLGDLERLLRVYRR